MYYFTQARKSNNKNLHLSPHAGLLYSALTKSSGSFSSLSFLLGPQSVATNVFRCAVAFAFVFAGLFVKTLLTVGMGDTMPALADASVKDVMGFLGSEGVVRDLIGRGVLSAVFQVRKECLQCVGSMKTKMHG